MPFRSLELPLGEVESKEDVLVDAIAGTLKVWLGRALRGTAFAGGPASFELADGWALRLRDRPDAPSCCFSSATINKFGLGGTSPFGIGEYGRGVEDGEKEETCRSMTNSCVAFVNFAISFRSVAERLCADP